MMLVLKIVTPEAMMTYRKTVIAVITAIALTLSCSGLMTRQERSVTDLESELAVLKKRVSMIEKKNALLEAENGDRKESLKRLKNDYAVLKTESDARIRDLAGMNARLRTDYAETTARLNAAIAMDCVALRLEGTNLVATRPMYGGKVLADVQLQGAPQMVAIRPNAFAMAEAAKAFAHFAW